MFNAVNYARYVIDNIDNVVIKADERFFKLMGYTAEDINKGNVTQKDLIPDDVWEEYVQTMEGFRKYGGTGYIEHPLKKKNGDVIYVYCFGQSSYSEEFKKDVSSILISDISSKEAIQKEVEIIRKKLSKQVGLLENFLEKVNSSMISGVFENDFFKILYCTPSTKSVFALESTDIFLKNEKSIFDFVNKDDINILKNIILKCKKDHIIQKEDLRFNIKGDEKWFTITCAYADDIESDNLINLFFFDITAEKQREFEMLLQHNFLTMLAENTKDLMIEYNCKSDYFCVFDLEVGERNIHISEFDFLKNIDSFKNIYDEDKKTIINNVNNLCNKLGKARFEVRFKLDSSKKYRWFSIMLVSVKNNANETIILGRCKDISTEVEEKQEFIRKARIDALTDIYNAETIKELIKNKINNYTNGISAFIIIDLDNFKNVNDTFGHLEGDKVLSQTGSNLKTVFSSNNCIVGRIGGDEFAVFIEDAQDKEEIISYAERICKLLKRNIKNEKNNNEVKISASIGIAYLNEKIKDYDTLFKSADKALYYKKAIGKSGYCIFDENIKNSEIYYKKQRD